MKYSFQQFQADYPNDETCLDAIMEMRHGKKPVCPACNKRTKYHRITERRAYACQFCGHHIYPCVGTPFEKSRTSLQKWFFAMYLFTASRNGVSAKELERALSVTYKTAWRMAHEIRKLMANVNSRHGPLSGHVEIDETFIGGKVKGQGAGSHANKKITVMGLIERDGKVIAGPVPDAKQKTLIPAALYNVEKGSVISTDKATAYSDLSFFGYEHEAVDHRAKEYVRGIHHTNTIEGFWSQVKRGVKGTYIHISRKHAPKYIPEFSYRHNMRKHPGLMFRHLVSCLVLPRLEAK